MRRRARAADPTTMTPLSQIRPYWFKLEFPDGRWSVQEKELAAAPGTGDCVDLGADGRWQVQGSRLVPVHPSGQPPREFFVCRPAV
jgi:hypothetical protein